MADIQETLKERGKRYGSFAGHARVTQALKDNIRSGENFDGCSSSHVEALDMIAHKIGRIVNGDPNYADSWVDIAGYAQLIVNQIEEEQKRI